MAFDLNQTLKTLRGGFQGTRVGQLRREDTARQEAESRKRQLFAAEMEKLEMARAEADEKRQITEFGQDWTVMQPLLQEYQRTGNHESLAQAQQHWTQRMQRLQQEGKDSSYSEMVGQALEMAQQGRPGLTGPVDPRVAVEKALEAGDLVKEQLYERKIWERPPVEDEERMASVLRAGGIQDINSPEAMVLRRKWLEHQTGAQKKQTKLQETEDLAKLLNIDTNTEEGREQMQRYLGFLRDDYKPSDFKEAVSIDGDFKSMLPSDPEFGHALDDEEKQLRNLAQSGTIEGLSYNSPLWFKKLDDLRKLKAKKKTKYTEGESKKIGFGLRMINTENVIKDLMEKNPNFDPAGGFEKMRSFTNWSASKEYQQYWNAAGDWYRAKLRDESGAVIALSEAIQEARAYFPVFGDSPEVIAQKEHARNISLMGVKAGAGGFFDTEEASYVPTATTQGREPVVVNTQAVYDALPVGTRYIEIDDDGNRQTMVKVGTQAQAPAENYPDLPALM